MVHTYVLFLFLAGLVGCIAGKHDKLIFESYFEETIKESPMIENDYQMLMRLLSQNSLPERYRPDSYFLKMHRSLASRVNGFKWSSCGGTGATIKSLSITPDPLQFPGTIGISADFQLNTDLIAPLQGNVTIAKKIVEWIPLPCFDVSGIPVGSCKYNDVCALLNLIQQCPSVLTSCKCPFKKGTYTIPLTKFDINASVIPSGDYKITASIGTNGKLLQCIEILLTVS